jgi:hypothetical protein
MIVDEPGRPKVDGVVQMEHAAWGWNGSGTRVFLALACQSHHISLFGAHRGKSADTLT